MSDLERMQKSLDEIYAILDLVDLNEAEILLTEVVANLMIEISVRKEVRERNLVEFMVSVKDSMRKLG